MGRQFITDEQADEGRAWFGWGRDDVEVPKIDPEDFEREQSFIQDLVEREMTRTARNVQAFVAPWNDRCCDLCKGRKMYAGMTCPDCYGTGAESIVLAGFA